MFDGIIAGSPWRLGQGGGMASGGRSGCCCCRYRELPVVMQLESTPVEKEAKLGSKRSGRLVEGQGRCIHVG